MPSIQPIRLAYGPEPAQCGDLYLPGGEGPHPVLIVIHGGRWQASSSLNGIAAACASLAEGGLAVWNVEYRRLGIPGGGWPGTWRDVAVAADFLGTVAAQHRLNMDQVVSLGHSAGGPLALWLAARHRVSPDSELYQARPQRMIGAISSAGVNDLRQAHARGMGEGVLDELLGGGPEQFPERYASVSPPDLLPFDIPQLMIHGTSDTMVSLAVSEEHQRAATAAGDTATLVIIPGADHFQIRDPASPHWAPARAAILDFCQSLWR